MQRMRVKKIKVLKVLNVQTQYKIRNVFSMHESCKNADFSNKYM